MAPPVTEQHHPAAAGICQLLTELLDAAHARSLGDPAAACQGQTSRP
jgi:hypothetical protein